MAAMEDAMKNAGVAPDTTELRCERCGKPLPLNTPQHTICDDCYQKEQAGDERKQGHAAPGDFADDYPDYFDEQGVLKCVYVTTGAEYIAQRLGAEKTPPMTMHQLRAFYQYVRLQEDALKNGRSFREVRKDLCTLKPLARERADKKKVPYYFESFISRNVDKVVADEDNEKAFSHAFVKGFVEHFQAVVAYCAGTIKEKRN